MLIIICFVSGWFIKCVPEIYFFTLKEKEQEEKKEMKETKIYIVIIHNPPFCFSFLKLFSELLFFCNNYDTFNRS